ncbi:MAG: cytochrome C [Planctomycetes bacterium]|nr:cytochrome C [Planctomycetota bacterium]
MDWHQLIDILTKPDNIPIIMLLVTLPFYSWYAFRQARKNDKLIDQLEADDKLAKTHHRTTHPYRKEWDKTVHVWPYLLRIEFLALLIVTFILMVWSITLNAPLEEPANPSLTMNPSKAPWYFLGLQEMLVYFDPWIAGVVLPSLIIVGLMAIPYIDVNPLGNGYYTWKQRKFSVGTYLFGFVFLWCGMIVIGTLIRGPGWQWFWPGQTWDHHRVIHEFNRDLHEFVGIGKGPEDTWLRFFFGGAIVAIYLGAGWWLCHKLFQKYLSKMYSNMSLIQIGTTISLMLIMMALPVKVILRLGFSVKYVWVTPWFNI